MSILRNFFGHATGQQRPERSDHVSNSAGGYVFSLDDAARLRRFLILGVDGGTYYASGWQLAQDNAAVVLRMASENPDLLVDTIVEVSTTGAAPKVQPALFALACAAAVPDSAPKALAALPQVARTATHLFIFAEYVQQFRGWGRALRRAIANWYTDRDVDALAYQVAKYRQREGWTHRDLLRLSHPHTDDAARRATFDWITHGATGDDLPAYIEGFLKAQQASDPTQWAALIGEYRLTWEMLPDAAMNEPAVWEAFLDTGIPMTALMRQLPRLTRLGLLPEMGGRTDEICARLADTDALRTARVHPVNVLVAQRTYAHGRSSRGSSTWEPTQKVVDALDAGFYAAFGAVEPANKRMMLAVDVSGSMSIPVSGTPLTAYEAATALALVQLATEPGLASYAFSGGLGWKGAIAPLKISPRQRLDDALRIVTGMPFGGTDCALPMLYATKEKLEVDTFVVYTDNETWAGEVHPFQALRDYREASGIDAKLVVAGLTATEFSIADPNDAGMLDVVGFDAAVPNLISEFARGF